jgi:lysophospholipase L1-like esterase
VLLSRSRRTRRRIGRIPLFRRVLFAALPLLLLLGSLELYARMNATDPRNFVGQAGMVMAPHRTRLWWALPGRYQQFGAPVEIGADGLRVTPQTGAALTGLTLGDSSIFGHGLHAEQTLDSHLGAALRARGVDIDVRCGGIPGYSSEQARVVMEEVGWDLEPDLLVIGALWSDARAERWVDREWMERLASPAGAISWWLSKSAAWRRFTAGPRAREQGLAYTLSWARTLNPDARRRVAIERYHQNLEYFADGAAARGAAVIFLAPCDQARLMGDPVEEPYFEAMRDLAGDRGLPLVDGAEVLRASQLDRRSGFLDDMHPTGEANRAYARALADALLAAGWPQAGAPR